MKKLIISLDTYTWIQKLSGTIIRYPNDYEVMVIFADDNRPIRGCNKLCKKSIYIQRSQDLFVVGKELGIKKLINLKYDVVGINIHKLTAQLQLQAMFSGIGEIIYPNNLIIDKVMEGIHNVTKINTLVYGDNYNHKCFEIVRLNDDEFNKKLSLKELMVGFYDKAEFGMYKFEYLHYPKWKDYNSIEAIKRK